ncbi:MAG: NUDIX hydrolase [Spirochaetes bacterium]|nr:NUDIX hydrolase [Spirochaetota bacterium]
MEKWIIKDKSTIFDEKLYRVKNLNCFHPVKKISYDFHIIETFNWINIIAITEDNKIIMVKQHRLGTDDLTLETVAGMIEHSEDPLEAAKRELHEETGYRESRMIFLKKTAVNPAIINNHIYFYLATGCKKVSEQKLDPAEDIEILLYSEDEVKKMIKDGTINHSIVIAALSLYLFFYECD